jgi:hypothetical protein
MHRENHQNGVTFAKALAARGELANWRAVRTRMLQLGYQLAPAWFADTSLCDGIDEICSASVGPADDDSPEMAPRPTFAVRES